MGILALDTVSDAGEPYYCTIAALRVATNTDTSSLPDATAIALIEDAEDVIDGLLGGWIIDSTTGRKIVAGKVEAWQFLKLTRATLKMCERIYNDPTLLSGAQYASERGPDFSFTGKQYDGPADQMILSILNQTGLRRLTGRSTNDPNFTSTNSDLAATFYRSGMPRYSG